MKFAVVLNNKITEYREYSSQPTCKIINGLLTVRPITEDPMVIYDENFYEISYSDIIHDTYIQRTWIKTPINIAIAKIKKQEIINKERDLSCYNNVTVNGKIWQADMTSQWLLSNSIRRAKGGKPLPNIWRTADNENIPITNIAILENIEDAIVNQVQNAYAVSWQRKTALETATTVEEVEAI